MLCLQTTCSHTHTHLWVWLLAVLITRLPELRLVLVTCAALSSSEAVIHMTVQPAGGQSRSAAQQMQPPSDPVPFPLDSTILHVRQTATAASGVWPAADNPSNQCAITQGRSASSNTQAFGPALSCTRCMMHCPTHAYKKINAPKEHVVVVVAVQHVLLAPVAAQRRLGSIRLCTGCCCCQQRVGLRVQRPAVGVVPRLVIVTLFNQEWRQNRKG